jgi:hypothetical protein
MIQTHHALSLSLLFMAVIATTLLVQPTEADSGVISAVPGQLVGETIVIGEGDLGAEVHVNVSFSSSPWELNPSNSLNTRQGSISVNGNGRWEIIASADKTTGGYPAEFDNVLSEFVPNGLKLEKAMKIRTESGNEVDLYQGGVLIEGEGDMTVPFTLVQDVSPHDSVLPEGHSYNIIISFDGSSIERA